MVGLAGFAGRSPSGLFRAVGAGVIAAVMIGDGVWGLLRVVETTGWLWWTISIAIGAGILAWVVVRRLDRTTERVVAVAVAAAGALAFTAVFSVL